MRSAAILFVLAVSGYAAKAQLTLLPQAGAENPVTRISTNNSGWVRPVSELQPRVGLRLDYRFKNGISPFAGLSTSRSLISYHFSDPEAATYSYRATPGKMQLQLQAGVQYSTKAIYFNKSKSKKPAESAVKKSGCSRRSVVSRCGSKSSPAKKASKGKGAFVKIQPFAGIGYMPAYKNDIETKAGSQPSFTYNAGNMQTLLLTGTGFEFGRNNKSSVTLSVSYFKALGNYNTTFSTESGTKTVVTSFNSKISGWSATLGMPISLAKKPGAKFKRQEKKRYECEQMRIQIRQYNKCRGY